MKSTLLYKQTVKKLSECYDIHAEKFSATRKKNRPEINYIIKKIQNEEKKQLSIVELWCGDGRLFGYLQESNKKMIASYQGVDISQWLLDIAQKNYGKDQQAKRIHDDMIHYLESCENESIDIVICVASFQHLPDIKSRNLFLQQVYRVLKYDWSFISIDRSRSKWMVTKHWDHITQSIKKYITSFWKREWNNILIPFQDKWKKNERLYHIFTLRELKRLLSKHGFSNGEFIYSSQKWDFHHNIFNARNICTYVRKKVFLE